MVCTTRQVLELPTAALRPNPMQPRRVFDPSSLEELAGSIRAEGILQPLTVRRTAEGWELVAGERRLRAAKLAGLDTVPCLETEAGDDESALLALMENLQREDLHFLEEASALSAFLRRSGMPQERAAEILGLSPSALSNKLRLLRLSPQCAQLLLEGDLSERHARALLRLEDEGERLKTLRYILAHGLNVAQAEQYIDRQAAKLRTTPPRGRKSYILKDVRLFLNSLDRGLRLMRSAGVDAQTERQDTEDAILLTIRIPKGRK